MTQVRFSDTAASDDSLTNLRPADDPAREPRAGRRRSLPLWIPLTLIGAGIVLVAVCSAVIVSSLSPELYGGRVDVLYAASAETPSDTRDRILATQQELIQSRAVLAPASTGVGLPLDELQDALSVEIGRDDLLRVTVSDRDAERARTIAQTIADQYLSVARTVSPDGDRGRRLIRERIARLSANENLGPIGRERRARLQERLLELELVNAAQPEPRLLTPAYVLDDPLSPQPLRAVALGLLLGLLLATTVIVLMVRQQRLRRG